MGNTKEAAIVIYLVMCIWGFLQLLCMGIGYFFHCPVMAEDLTKVGIVAQKHGFIMDEFHKTSTSNFAHIAYSCFLASGMNLVMIIICTLYLVHLHNKKKAQDILEDAEEVEEEDIQSIASLTNYSDKDNSTSHLYINPEGHNIK